MNFVASHSPAASAVSKAPAILASHNQAVAAAHRVAPRIAARADLAEAERNVPTETIDELQHAGLFGVMTPRRFGGSELGLATMVDVATILGNACGSTGWVYGVLTGHDWLVSLFAPEAQQDVFNDPAALVASVFRLKGNVTAVEGGWRITAAQGRFCSGVAHASWVIVGASLPQPDGTPEAAFLLVPIADVRVIDDWFTAGMRGTGSRSIHIADAFVPSHRVVTRADVQAGCSAGAAFHGSPAYALPFTVVQPFSLIGALLGMGQAGLQNFSSGRAGRSQRSDSGDIAAAGVTYARVADAGADIDAARALVLRDCALLAGDLHEFLPQTDRSRMQRNLAYAGQKCRYAINRLFEASGGSGIYETGRLQRIWRDLNAAAAHVAFAWDPAAAAYGRDMLETRQA